MFFKKELHKLESKSNFLLKISEYYRDLSKGVIPENLLDELVLIITNNQYNSYKECWKKYPKSKKRYSIFVTDDLKQPNIYFDIINSFEEKEIGNTVIKKYCQILFNMNENEFKKIEEYKNWYDAK
jgi:hypothetical protein